MAELTIKREKLVELTENAIQESASTEAVEERLQETARTTGAIQVGTAGGDHKGGGGGPGCVSAQALGRVNYVFAYVLDNAIIQHVGNNQAAIRRPPKAYPTIKVVDG